MITLEQACEIFIRRTGFKYIGAIQETEEMFVFSIIGDNGEEYVDSGRTISKENGKFGVYTPPLRYKTFRDLKPLEIPEKYRYHGEIK